MFILNCLSDCRHLSLDKGTSNREQYHQEKLPNNNNNKYNLIIIITALLNYSLFPSIDINV